MSVRLGVQVRVPPARTGNVVDDLVAHAAEMRAAGLSSLWLAQGFELDALTALALVGRAVPDLELGTAVVPTYPRHPVALAGQALTVQAATGDRLVLGLGPSHPPFIEGVFGTPWDPPIEHLREYLAVLRPLLRGELVDVQGARWSARTTVPVTARGGGPCPVLLGALGPRMLELAGKVADGTVTTKTGVRTLADHVVPRITAAAERAGRPAPRVVAILPVCVTADIERARAEADALYGATTSLASYQASMAREGVASTADLALIGDEAAVARQVRAVADAGATDLVARLFGTEDDQRRTLEVLGQLHHGPRRDQR